MSNGVNTCNNTNNCSQNTTCNNITIGTVRSNHTVCTINNTNTNKSLNNSDTHNCTIPSRPSSQSLDRNYSNQSNQNNGAINCRNCGSIVLNTKANYNFHKNNHCLNSSLFNQNLKSQNQTQNHTKESVLQAASYLSNIAQKNNTSNMPNLSQSQNDLIGSLLKTMQSNGGCNVCSKSVSKAQNSRNCNCYSREGQSNVCKYGSTSKCDEKNIFLIFKFFVGQEIMASSETRKKIIFFKKILVNLTCTFSYNWTHFFLLIFL